MFTTEQEKYYKVLLKHYNKLEDSDRSFDFNGYSDPVKMLSDLNIYIHNCENGKYLKVVDGEMVVKKIVPEYSKLLKQTINEILPEDLQEKFYDEYIQLICDHKNGVTIYWYGVMIVPLFAITERSEEYFKYYVCHELSHAISDILYDNAGSENNGHNDIFYKTFMNITPKELWKYEIDHFPHNSHYIRKPHIK